MQKKIFGTSFLILVTLSICMTSCSSSADKESTTSKAAVDRSSGYKSPDGIYVGPRGDHKADGTPVGLGAYGRRESHKGNFTITKDGTTLANIDVAGAVLINADDVTITNFTAERVTQKPGKKGMVLENGTIEGKQKNNDGIQWSDFTLRKMDISGTFDGVKAQGNVIIEDSYIHDLHAFRSNEAGAGGYSHNDCVQISSGKNVLIERNWMVSCGFNSAIFIDPDQGAIDSVTVQHNYLDSGGITLYAIASRSAEHGLPTNVNIINNVFGDTHLYDYATIGAGVTFLHNVKTNGEEITPRTDTDAS